MTSAESTALVRAYPALLLFFLIFCACGREGGKDESAQPESPDAVLQPWDEEDRARLRAYWENALRAARPSSGAVSVVDVPLKRGGALPEHLRGIALRESPTVSDCRDYVAEIVVSAARHRSSFARSHPEVGLLEAIGPNCGVVLIEPFMFGPPVFDGDLYLIEALKSSATSKHRALVIESLRRSPQLLEVVRTKGWLEDCRRILGEALGARSGDLDTGWIEAAAEVLGEDAEEDLAWHLLHGQNPHVVWEAMRGRIDPGRLASRVAEAWHAPAHPVGTWKWRSLALVAAEFGHADALAVVVERLAERDRTVMDHFMRLTGYAHPGAGPREWELAQEWFERNRERLTFDSELMRYTVPPR